MALIRCHSNFKINEEDLDEETFAKYWSEFEYYLQVVYSVKLSSNG